MPRDFTLNTYRLLLDALKDYKIYTIRRFLQERPVGGFALLRHDVDRMPINALRVAEIEVEYGIASSFYFRVNKSLDIETVKKIAHLGHEVGYHYEVLGKMNGDKQKALQLFKSELSFMRSFCDVDTMSRHGKPLSKYDDEALWNEASFESYGIIGDAGISIKSVPYYTDSGRSWNGVNSIRDVPYTNGHSASTSFDLITMLKTGVHEKIYLNTHPERWVENDMEWFFSFCVDNTVNVGKRFIRYFMSGD